MSFPILYQQSATDFFNLGLGPITNAKTATVTEERNGSFIFEATIFIDDVIYPQLENDMLIRADAGQILKDQRFRIKKITPNHDGTAQIYAEHVSYLANELSLKPEITINGAAQMALTQWKGAIIDDNPFTVYSDVPTVSSTSWRIDKVENARRALGGVEGSILDRWGGEYLFDNYSISLLQKRGTTAETVLAYGRNITDFEQEKNIADTFNSIYPYAIYTTTEEESSEQTEHLVHLNNYFVDAENIASFPNRRALPVNFSSEFEQEEVPSQARLAELAAQYIKNNNIGTPKTSFKVSFLDLSKTSDYAGFAPLEQVSLCDDVRVVYPKLGVDTVSKVIRTVWNVLTDSYDEIEIGEKRMTLSSILNDQQNQLIEQEELINSSITSADGKNTIFFGLFGKDGLGEPKANKVGDMWYKPAGTETEFYQWDGTQWLFIMSTAGITEAKKAAEEAKTAGELALAAGEDAMQAALNARDEALKAIATANSVVEIATNAANEASLAKNAAEKAVENSQAAFDEAVKVGGELTIISNTLDNTNGQVETIISNVSDNEAKILNLSSSYDSLSSTISEVQMGLDGKVDLLAFSNLSQTVDSIQSSVVDKADKSEIIQLSNQITSTVSEVDGLSSQVTQLAGSLNFRVTNNDGSITQIDLINGRVSIAGNQVDITGNTYIEKGIIGTAEITDLAVKEAKIAYLAVTTAKIADLAVTDAKIGNITANKITTGVLNAALVNIINLNANNISTGTLKSIIIQGANSYWNLATGMFQMTNPSNTSQYITIQNGTFKSYNGSNYVQIYNDTFTAYSYSRSIKIDPTQIHFTIPGYQRQLYLTGQGIAISSNQQTGTGAGLNAGLEIWSKGAQAYIDFATGGRMTNDYDTRIVSVAGTTSTGQGQMELYARALVFAATDIDFRSASWQNIPNTIMRTDPNNYYRITTISRRIHTVSYIEFNLGNGEAYGVDAWASDESLKSNIAPIHQNMVSKINQLKVVEFDWNATGLHEDLGMIAQQVEAILPSATFQNSNGIRQLRYTVLIPALVKAVQDLSKEVNELRGDLFQLKAKGETT